LYLGARIPVSFYSLEVAQKVGPVLALGKKSPFDGKSGFAEVERLSARKASLAYLVTLERAERIIRVSDGRIEADRRIVSRSSLTNILFTEPDRLELIGGLGLSPNSPSGPLSLLGSGLTSSIKRRDFPSKLKKRLLSTSTNVSSFTYSEDDPDAESADAQPRRVVTTVAGPDLRKLVERRLPQTLRMRLALPVAGKEMWAGIDFEASTVTIFNKLKEPIAPAEVITLLDQLSEEME
jgi:hypothetical protein